MGHGGVALLWNLSLDDFIQPLSKIESDRIVGIKCSFPGISSFFVLSIYLPSANHPAEEFQEYCDYLWALYESLSVQGYTILMGDFNCDLGNSMGDRAPYEPNQRGLKLAEFPNYFNLCAVNLLKQCSGPVYTYHSYYGRYRSTIDYIFLPNCLFDSIVSVKTLELDIDNTSDHLPVQTSIILPDLSFNKLSSVNNAESSSKNKILWSKFSHEEIHEKYVNRLLSDLEYFEQDFCDSVSVTENLTSLIVHHSCSLKAPTQPKSVITDGNNRKVYARLPDNVKSARILSKSAFDSWKASSFPLGSVSHDNYRSEHRNYRSLLRSFLSKLESDKVKKLCNASENNERLFWSLIKGQRSSSQMSAFLVNGKLITDKNKIREMWADHFETLGTPSDCVAFNNVFFSHVSERVKSIYQICIDDSSAVLCEPLQYEEVAAICSKLKPGVSGVMIDYEHIRFAGPALWDTLFQLYDNYFATSSVSKSLKTGIILPLFKGKGAKADNTDNYRGITLFATLCKIYEMILLNRLEKFAKQQAFFSNLQFGFEEGVGCIEASFTILETTNHMLERGSKVFGCFLDVRKAFDTVWIDGLLYKLFTELGIEGKIWLAIKDLYTDV